MSGAGSRATGCAGSRAAGCAGERGAEALAAAMGWLGTPYRHQGSLRGVGADCLGLVRGVYRELYGMEPEEPPPYPPDWALAPEGDPMREAAARHLRAASSIEDRQPGDVLLFRFRPGGPAQHMGILASRSAEAESFIHAYEQAAVVLSPLPPAWQRRIVGVFRF